MKKVLGTIFLIVYSIIAIAVTILLLSYNEYMCSEVNGYTVYIVKDETLEPDFVKGDLLLVKKADPDKIEVGDKLFLHQNISDSEYRVRYGALTEKFGYGARTIYNIDNEYQFDSTYLMGSDEGLLVYHKWGTVLGLLTSRWGYLFCIVIVTLLLFLEELYELFMEIKYGDDMDDDDDYEDEEDYDYEEDYDEEDEIVEVKRTRAPRKTESATRKTSTKVANAQTGARTKNIVSETKSAPRTSSTRTTKTAPKTNSVKTTRSTPKASATKATSNTRKTSSNKTSKSSTTVKNPKDPKEKV